MLTIARVGGCCCCCAWAAGARHVTERKKSTAYLMLRMTLTSILSIRDRFANLFLKVRHREFKIPSTISGHTALGAETRRRKKRTSLTALIRAGQYRIRGSYVNLGSKERQVYY